MRGKYKFLSGLSIKKKLLLSILVVLVVPSFCIGFFLVSFASTLSFEQSAAQADAAVNQTQAEARVFVAGTEGYVKQLFESAELERMTKTNFLSPADELEYYNSYIKPLFARNLSQGARFQIRIFSDNQTLTVSGETNNRLSELEHCDWYSPATAGYQRDYQWSYTNEMGTTDYAVCYRTKMAPSGSAPKIVFAVFLDLAKLKPISGSSEDGSVYLFSAGDRVLYSTDSALSGARMSELTKSFSSGIDGLQNRGRVTYEGDDYNAFKRDIPGVDTDKNAGSLLRLIPSAALRSPFKDLLFPAAVIFSIFTLLAVILATVISTNITSRLSILLDGTKMVAGGTFKPIGNIAGADEIAELSQSYNTMVKKIRELIDDVYIANINTRDAQILAQKLDSERLVAERLALQRQINPHYMFNTLESIRMNLIIKGDRETANIVHLFACTLRDYVYCSDQPTTLSEELQFVEKYIVLQRYRFGDKIHLELDVPAELYCCEMPRLILQPVVENAVFHGLECKAGGGTISISAKVREQNLLITVADDGKGIERSELEKLKAFLEDGEPTRDAKKTHGIALKNIQNRLRYQYGAQYGLTIEGGDEGVTITLEMPYLEHQKGDLEL